MRITNTTKTIAFCCFAFFAILYPIYSNNIPYLDDYYLINEQLIMGFWGPTQYFQNIWGVYRAVYTFLMSIIFSFSDNIWALRTLGVTLHFMSAALIFAIIKSLSFSRITALISFVFFLFFPYALEAIAWPSNIGQYPLAPFLTLLGALIVIKSDNRHWRIVLGGVLMAFSIYIHEQIGPIILALAFGIFWKINKKNRILFSLAIMLPIIANLLLIYMLRDGNIRLSGADAANIKYVLRNIGYFSQLIKTTPLGEFYYSSAGIKISWPSIIIFVSSKKI